MTMLRQFDVEFAHSSGHRLTVQSVVAANALSAIAEATQTLMEIVRYPDSWTAVQVS
jgi:hypothetical protein